MDVDGRTLLLFGAKAPAYIFGGQWWRLITAGFLHGGLFHIMMNSWVLFDLGAQVEEVYGTSRLLVIYFLATVFGFLASTFWSPALSIGASAGVFGLIGAMIALGTRYQTAVGTAIRGMYIRWAIYGILFGLLPLFAVDNAAHIGGLAAGFLTGYIAGIPRPVSPVLERTWQVLAGCSLALTVLAFALMFLWFSAVSGL
ncbi:MAG: rhomboid family intramembrane serine protease [Acidobacteria bacterium]|nr:rhomboid family intramembrane serine protease [Acidobacteriota bacterium]